MTSAVRVLSFSLMIAALGSVDAAAQRGRGATRFPGIDANADGVITRAEWRGSVRSFQVHDWNNDGVLSGDEVKPGVRRPARGGEVEFDSPEREYEMNDWTAKNFASLDHNKDGRIARDEWHFDREGFRRADHNGDGAISRVEFLGEDVDDDREDRFQDLDVDGDARISRNEWHADPARFTLLDDNRDGFLTRAEALGGADAPPELFTSVDGNRDRVITRDEWHWSRASFDARDANRDGRLSRQEFEGTAAPPDRQSAARKAGYERGLTEGRAAGREDRERKQGWDLEGQRELETADSGYEPRAGARAEYQAGYREGFRRGYREGWGPR
jgi:Ca2+-binding EF-hand superfamily protein